MSFDCVTLLIISDILEMVQSQYLKRPHSMPYIILIIICTIVLSGW